MPNGFRLGLGVERRLIREGRGLGGG